MAEIKRVELFVVSFMLFQGFLVALNCTNPTPDALYDAIQNSTFLNNDFRPVKSFSSPLKVKHFLIVVGIVQVDEKAQTLTTKLWQTMEWNITGLSWDENECGTDRVSVRRDQVWLPDVTINELIDDGQDKQPQNVYVYLDNTGKVTDDIPLKVITICALGIYYFPFDVQNCTLTFGPFLHIVDDVKMVRGDRGDSSFKKSIADIQTNGEWDMQNITSQPYNLTENGKNYSEIIYSIVLKRRSTTYVVNLLIPSIFLIIIDVFSFFIPLTGVDRSSLKMTLILGYTVFLLIMNDLLPVTGDSTPLINVFFAISLALMVTSLLETIFITHIRFATSNYRRLPSWLRVLVMEYLAVLVRFPRKKPKHVYVFFNRPLEDPTVDTKSNISEGQLQELSESENSQTLTSPLSLQMLNEMKKLSRDLAAIRLHVDKHIHESTAEEEWEIVAVVLDRVFFGLYLIFIVMSFITIICLWAQH